ncbi:hypothetical protein BpHYR1_043320 [Brachionus plicatilis]|uniref:Uncharacterized protein n=1 Tax=Brachionus plicatilis TaxID=10195 RepID=A0A3M7QHY8_BRAPC|nr:hypothetical protein BpHYR1_043320 [Brachionus plicatilis]
MINSKLKIFVISQDSFFNPRAILYLTSKSKGVDTTDLVRTTMFSKPIIVIKYGNISPPFRVGVRPKWEHMPIDMNREMMTWAKAANARPHFDLTNSIFLTEI